MLFRPASLGDCISHLDLDSFSALRRPRNFGSKVTSASLYLLPPRCVINPCASKVAGKELWPRFPECFGPLAGRTAQWRWEKLSALVSIVNTSQTYDRSL
ncbi:hypothetical protein V8C34DRAFT_291161 [Trichoderma compactum]